MATTLTWLGHAAFRIDTPGGKRIYIDPFLNGNPKCPDSEQKPERVDAISSPMATATTSATRSRSRRKFGCPVVAHVELRGWLAGQGVE